MIELEVYAAGVRDLNKILELDHELEAIPGLRYKVDRNHDLVYLELEEPTMSVREIRGVVPQARSRAALHRRHSAGVACKTRNATAQSVVGALVARTEARSMIARFFTALGAAISRSSSISARSCCSRRKRFASLFTHRLRWSLFLRQIVEIGLRSQLVVVITGAFHRRGFRRADLFSIQQARDGLRRRRGCFGLDLPRTRTGSHRA